MKKKSRRGRQQGEIRPPFGAGIAAFVSPKKVQTTGKRGKGTKGRGRGYCEKSEGGRKREKPQNPCSRKKNAPIEPEK